MNMYNIYRSVHDEYWHSHVDTEQYGSFAFTSMLYLNNAVQAQNNNQNENNKSREIDGDFEGGEFEFLGESPLTIVPEAGLVTMFTSGSENPHKVNKVTKGKRRALITAFTCDPKQSLGSFASSNLSWLQDVRTLVDLNEQTTPETTNDS